MPRVAFRSMQGRRSGTPGNVKATDLIAAEARRLGLEPAGEDGGWFQTVPIVRRTLDPASALPVDGATFKDARFGIPFAFFTTGSHPDYHQLTDQPQYIDYDKLARVTRLVADLTTAVAGLDHRVVVDKPKPDPEGVCKQ